MAEGNSNFKHYNLEKPEYEEEKQKALEETMRKWFPEGREAPEVHPLSREEISDRKKIEAELEKSQISGEERREVLEDYKKIQEGSVKAKIERLLALAQEKGLPYAVNVAKEAKDPYLLDVFHDMLAKDKFFWKLNK